MKQLCLIEVPGLTRRMVEEHAPKLLAASKQGQLATLQPDLPALTISGHASLLTGTPASQHGIVGNGWFDREENVVKFWPQSERLVHGETIWEAARERHNGFRTLKHFWWPGMASSADIHTNVRPVYFADGRKAPDIYANQPGLAKKIQDRFGTFPMFQFWGPGVNIRSSQWIADTAKFLFDEFQPDLSLVYLPHLDYKQQTVGPDDPSMADEVRQLDDVAYDLIEHLQRQSVEFVLVSSYHMNQVNLPIEINRVLRRGGWLKVSRNAAGELIDYGMSQAFAVADHQIAHVYVADSGVKSEVATRLNELDGVDRVLDADQQTELDLAHERAGDLVVLAKPNAWFTYYYWEDEALAPDFARTIAIHAKPGYDPCEMLFDERLRFPKLAVATRLLRKRLGMRYTMDVISLNPNLIRGSHGLQPTNEKDAPVWLSSAKFADGNDQRIPITEVKSLILRAIFDD